MARGSLAVIVAALVGAATGFYFSETYLIQRKEELREGLVRYAAPQDGRSAGGDAGPRPPRVAPGRPAARPSRQPSHRPPPLRRPAGLSPRRAVEERRETVARLRERVAEATAARAK